MKSGLTRRAQRSGHAGRTMGWCCQKPTLAPAERAAGANIACGHAPWKITAPAGACSSTDAKPRRARQIMSGREARGDGSR